MNHLAILPILLPMLAGVALLLPPFDNTLKRQRIIGFTTAAVNLVIALIMIKQSAAGEITVYALGGWLPPEGISLVVDRLSALMIALTAILFIAALLFSSAGEDNAGHYFYPLMMFQVMGINGAFLTGDLFNLFVFFEILLIASYSLLIHGGGKHRIRAAVHYVLLNLVGSIIFLFALGILYGSIGTLNMADMAVKVRELEGADLQLAKIGGMLLMVVFGLKAAMLPLQFWLPSTYAAAPGPIAALFAIMTKVGIYSLIRVHGMIFGAEAGALAEIIQPWIGVIAILTLALGTIGVLTSTSLKRLIGHLIVISIGTLLLTIAFNNQLSLGAALFYAVHSTLAAGALFLIAEVIAEQRGKAQDRIVRSRALGQPIAIGIAFFISALTLVGMPPFSGFIGKIMVLQSAEAGMQTYWSWPALLISSLAVLIAFSRAGSTLFWRVSDNTPGDQRSEPIKYIAIWTLLAGAPLLAIFAGSITGYTDAAAQQLLAISADPSLLLPGGSK